MSEVIMFYCFVGIVEFEFIEVSGFFVFLLCLFEQFIFYFVMNEVYVCQIVWDWNVWYNDDYCGFVMCFDVCMDIVDSYDCKVVGGVEYEEFWVFVEEFD